MSFINQSKRTTTWFLNKARVFMLRHDWLGNSSKALLRRYPKLEIWLMALVGGSYQAPVVLLSRAKAVIPSKLTPRARRIYSDLKVAIKTRQKEDG